MIEFSRTLSIRPSMAKDELSRKLAVILHTDVVGSTALVQQNETLAHERMQGAFQLICNTIKSYSGIPHEIRGDAVVVEFQRASDAVAAALACQAANAEINSRLDDGIRPELRMGISLGEKPDLGRFGIRSGPGGGNHFFGGGDRV